MLIQETKDIKIITIHLYYQKYNMYLIRKIKQPLQSFVFTQECPLLKGEEQTWIANLILN